MKKSDIFWNMFWETGKIEPYLHYKLQKQKEKDKDKKDSKLNTKIKKGR